MTINLNPCTFNESSPGRHEDKDDIDSNELEEEKRHAGVKQIDDEVALDIFDKDSSIYKEHNGTGKGADPGVSNGYPRASLALR